MIKEDYWCSNPQWYEKYINNEGLPSIRMTNKAPKEAIESFERYCSLKEEHNKIQVG